MEDSRFGGLGDSLILCRQSSVRAGENLILNPKPVIRIAFGCLAFSRAIDSGAMGRWDWKKNKKNEGWSLPQSQAQMQDMGTLNP